jgi:exopolyphosphatase/guanosine-5'-triphosphate,3'-diphosphate pyrophosphatase
MTRVFAAADIGSNTAHLLVAATDGNLVMRIDNYNEWIPLGEVVARQGQIPKEIIQNLVLAMKEFKRVAAAKQASSLYVFATEGMRMARNHEQVLKKIFDESGIRVDVIPPQREAELSLGGVMLDVRNLGVDMMWEVGGGSAQVGRIVRNELVQEDSLPLGTGRIIAESGLRQPCPEYARVAAERYVDSTIERCKVPGTARMPVASGGVARGLWRALHPDGEKQIALEELEYLIWAVSQLPSDRIVSRFGVKNKRATTLLPGALVYRALMNRFGVSQMVVSEFGIREGAVLELASGRVKGGSV